jgi:hypothetical protein
MLSVNDLSLTNVPSNLHMVTYSVLCHHLFQFHLIIYDSTE